MAASSHVEVERTFELAPGVELPDLTQLTGVVAAVPLSDEQLDATYVDTADLRLARARTTLRRRTGGRDPGWHLKLPLGGDAREELHRPARGRAATVPEELAGLVRARTRGGRLEPVVRLRTARRVWQLLDADERVLAEVADDDVIGDVLTDPVQTVVWREVEVELVDGDAALLDAVTPLLQTVGAVPSARPSKLARTLGGRLPVPAERSLPRHPNAGQALVEHLHEHVEELVARDSAVRRDAPDSVHKMRVATRRLRGALKTFRPLLDRETTDPLRDELKHLAGVLGHARDAEVLHARLTTAVDELPDELVLGPVRQRLGDELGRRYREAHAHVVRELDDERYRTLLDSLDRLVDAPPLSEAAQRPAKAELRRLVRRTWVQLERSVATAQAAGTPAQREHLLHQARKDAKQARYAAEAAVPVLGSTARAFARRLKSVQEVLGEQQDSVVARDALRTLALAAHGAGENGFTFGLLHGLEQARGAAAVDAFADVWVKASRRKDLGRLR